MRSRLDRRGPKARLGGAVAGQARAPQLPLSAWSTRAACVPDRSGYYEPTLTLAAYVGEGVTIRFDPRDMGEIRVFHRDRFLCRAISADLAGQTIPLREIVNARKRRREELRTIVRDRLKTVDTLLEFKRGMQREDVHASAVTPAEFKRSKLKRYYNE
jgi:Mu transposase, C-terminal